MYLERDFFNAYVKSGPAGRAVATFIYMKNSFRNGSICGFTYALMSQITGWSAPTCRRQLKVLINLGLVRFERSKSGAGRVNLRLARRCAKIWQDNIDFSKIRKYRYSRRTGQRCGSAKDLYYLVLGYAVTECQRRKDEVKYLIEARLDPGDSKELKRARRKLKKLGVSDGAEFSDGGTSYAYIQSQLECSPYLVSKAIKKGDGEIFVKHRHKVKLDPSAFPVSQFSSILLAFEAEGMPGRLYCTRRGIYHNLANTYSVV